MPQSSDTGWNVTGALATLRACMDPYVWDQGQELYHRGAAEDVAVLKDETVQVKVLDPRDARHFFVGIRRDAAGLVVAKCACPYRFEGVCRHQVVALEYLRTVSAGEDAPGAGEDEPTSGTAQESAGQGTSSPSVAPGDDDFGLLYRVFGTQGAVKTTDDGSLLRVALHELGSATAPHRVVVQLYTGTGWTEVRTGEVRRWIARGSDGPHPRDAFLTDCLTRDGALEREIDSETLGAILRSAQGSEALVDRAGRALRVSPWPCYLASRLVAAKDGKGGAETEASTGTLGVEFTCQSQDGESYPLDEVSIIASLAPWIQLEDGSFCPLVAGVSGAFLERLQSVDFSSVPDEELDRFLTEGIERLERLCLGKVEATTDLIREVEGVDSARIELVGNPGSLRGALEFSYGGEWVVAPRTPEPWTVSRGGEIHRYPPAGQSLAKARRELEAIGFHDDAEAWVLEGPGVLRRILEARGGGFVQIELPRSLQTLDLVERAPVLKLRVGRGDGFTKGPDYGESDDEDGSAKTARRGSGIAWLEVNFELRDGERRLPVDLPALQEALHERLESGGSPGLFELSDGTVLSLEHDAVKTLAAWSNEGERRGAPETSAPDTFGFPAFLAGELMEDPAGADLELAPEVTSFLGGLHAEGGASPIALREDVAEFLRPYQKRAVEWLGQLARYGLCGVLADEMGLGKTIMTLAHFFGRADSSEDVAPVLVVCPTSLSFNWVGECKRFFPQVEARSLVGEPPAKRAELIAAGGDLLVTSYALLRRDREFFEARELRALVLDEAQHIKNAESQTAKAACALRVPERWGLTGTPVENHLGELWSIFHFALPGLLDSAKEFQEDVAEPIARGEAEVAKRLRRRLRPFLLRRTKEQVLPDLSPRIEQLERVPMTEVQRGVYETYLGRARAEIEGADSPQGRLQILAALTRLRQICCHPRLVLSDEEAAKLGGDAGEISGGKFDLLAELLNECLEEGHRVLLFSQFTKMLDLIEEDLDARAIARCRLDGSTRDREAVVRRFRETSTIPIFLISLKAGGFGLNLTEADTVILYDPWWNPATEEQAAARAHRLGQTVPVHVHKLVTAGTVEEKILDLQASKRDLASRVVDAQEDALGAMSEDELKDLLFD